MAVTEAWRQMGRRYRRTQAHRGPKNERTAMAKHTRRRTVGLLQALAALSWLAGHGALAGELSPWLDAATRHDVDPLLLYAIALKESPRQRPDGYIRPWPWAIHSPKAGEGALYFETSEQALRKIEALIAEGYTNIDIGIMQINWKYNGHLLPEPAKLLLPEHNIELGARILRANLETRPGDLKYAIARYHSTYLDRGLRYAESVLFIVEQLQGMSSVHSAIAE